MSSEATPISPVRFAEALRDLPISTLHLKALELRNSIAHLDYSNEQLKPFADGTDPSLPSPTPDPDCVEAIKENEVVIARMQERIELLKKEVERRGGSWNEFLTPEEVAEGSKVEEAGGEDVHQGDYTNASSVTNMNGTRGPGEMERSRGGGGSGERSSAWTDGTFTTGTIVGGEVVMNDANTAVEGGSGSGNAVNGNTSRLPNGTGGRLGDEELRRRMEERMRALADEDDEGMHL